MYTIHLQTGEVKDEAGVVVAPAQSVDDPIYVKYVEWVNLGNSPTEIVEEVIPQ